MYWGRLQSASSSVDFENLESAGILGLVEASHQFDPTHGVPFRTFAYPRVGVDHRRVAQEQPPASEADEHDLPDPVDSGHAGAAGHR